MIDSILEIERMLKKEYKEVTGKEFDKEKSKDMIEAGMAMSMSNERSSVREKVSLSLGLLLINLTHDKLIFMLWEAMPEDQKDVLFGGNKKGADNG